VINVVFYMLTKLLGFIDQRFFYMITTLLGFSDQRSVLHDYYITWLQ